ncbi:hypothetical protein [Streptomyces sp. A0592]|uniref:hypothetical protein n=1 Tax=Streptomyces sp. A0592 TaxID=2563099 RepID=UPI00109EA3A5|nr:hypothetical protein [Streptomyces sp. A0592]THA74358.1 hypothetical protein E6U81_38055 [Streptomyces sp. A0592]
MSAALNITFRAPHTGADSGVVPLGRKHFRLYAGPDGIPLPEVVLEQDQEGGGPAVVTVHLPARIEVRAESGSLIPAQLAYALQACWVPQEFAPITVDGPRTLSAEALLPTSLVHPDTGPAVAPDGEPLRLDVYWSVDYAGSQGAETAHGAVMLEFAPPGERPGPAPQAPQEDDLLRLRELAGTGHQHEFVVVDFGTTASTATLHDEKKVKQRLVDPAQVAALSAMLADLLGPPADAPPEWRDEVRALLAGTVTLPREDGTGTTGSTVLARVAEPGAADALMLRVESIRQQAGPELRRWLNRRLHAGYAAVIGTPPLERHGVRPVGFPDGHTGRRTHAPASSMLEVDYPGGAVPEDPRARRFELCGDDTRGLTGIKRAALQLKPEPVAGSDLSADHLAQHMYWLLVEGAEEATYNEALGTISRVPTVVVTYPTTILPEVKDRLKELVGRALGGPMTVMDYDEGLAAGLYFLMRDLTDDLNAGLEALRARCRRVGDDPPTWHRIMLVIDIGGGTTDIALLRLTLVDQTPELTEEQEFVAGRNYRLEPELLGSTGHERLGGDLLTLQVLYWIKARLVDELRSPGQEPDDGAQEQADASAAGAAPRVERRALAEAVAEQAADQLDTIVSDGIRQILSDCLPTDWAGVVDQAEREARYTRFRLLWRLAERKKRELGAPGAADAVLKHEDVDAILRAAPHTLGAVRGPITLDAGEFRTLMRPVLRRAAKLGADLVRGSFRRIHEENALRVERGLDPLPEPVLDQVVLSGRTSSLEQLQEQVVAALRQDEADGRTGLGWHEATELSVEREFAKQATSLGAAWAHSVRNRAGQIEHNDNRSGRTGGSVRMSDLDIRLQGLFSSLPCDFGPVGQMGRVNPLLWAGDPFIELDSSGRLGVRTGWNPLSRVVELHRDIGSGDSIQWGVFDLALTAKAENFTPLESVWRPPSGSGRGVRYRIEMDHRLVASILLCNGPAHLLVGGLGLELDGLVPGLSFDPELPGCSVPGRICVATGVDEDGVRRLVEVFPATGPSGPAGDGSEQAAAAGYLPESFHDTADADELPLPGRVAAIPVPPLEANHTYTYEFHLDRGDGDPVFLGRLSAAQQGRHHATLDARGRLRVHRGVVPYVPAETLREVQRYPGRVLGRRMDPPLSDFNHHWDPNSGRH